MSFLATENNVHLATPERNKVRNSEHLLKVIVREVFKRESQGDKTAKEIIEMALQEGVN